jgi:uncharacterized protein with GYD domain
LTRLAKRQGIVPAGPEPSSRTWRTDKCAKSAFEPEIRAKSWEESTMPTYIVLASFTEQGIKNIKDSPKRAQAFKDAAKKSGATVKEIFWTLGQYDIVTVVEAPDDATMTAIGLSTGKQGNVRTQTLRAFSEAEVKGILGKVA